MPSIFLKTHTKHYVVTVHYNRLEKTILMNGHNIVFDREIGILAFCTHTISSFLDAGSFTHYWKALSNLYIILAFWKCAVSEDSGFLYTLFYCNHRITKDSQT